MSKLTEKQIDAKAAELSKKFDCVVTPIVITHNDEKIVGYFQEPSYDVLMYAVDAHSNREISKAMEAAFSDCLLKEESDNRITSIERKNAKIKSSFTAACIRFINPHLDEYKKK